MINIIRVLWLSAVFIGILPCMAQTFKGKIIDESGNPVSYASLYLRELKSGLTTDNNGNFRTTLKAGNYTCDVSSIGFTNQTFTFRMQNEDLEKNIILKEQIYALKEVEIWKGKEDPAYAVMRQAIARAPYFRTQVKSFTAGSYLKGTGKINSIPALLKLSKEVRKESKEFVGKLYVMEEQQLVTFKSPNIWDKQVKAYRNSFPDDMKIEIGLTTINFYEPTLFGKISPLSRGAFSYYRFKYEGCYSEGDYLINKIKVIPKKDNPRLVEGELFIVEDLWCVASANISFGMSGVKATAKVTCKEVQPSVFLATSTSVACTMDMMGLKGEATYLAAVHYTKVEVGSWKPVAEEKKNVSKKVGQINEQIEKLTSKENMTLDDAYKLSRLMEKVTRETDTLQRKNKYELPSRVAIEKAQTDSLAGKRDTFYWASIRSVPLRLEEVQSYIEKEKKLAPKDTLSNKEKRERSLAGKIASSFFWGKTFRTQNKKVWITLLGLPAYIPRYNFVDGFWLGAKIKTGINFSESTSLQFIPSAYYTSARKAWVGQGELILDYAPRRRGQLSLIGGVLTADYNEETGESILVNSVATSFFGRNDVKLFDKRFLAASHQIELANSLLFTSSLEWQRRSMLENHISRSWFKRTAQPNIPDVVSFRPMPENEILKASFALEYTPAHYYRMNQGKKIYRESRFPTFRLSYDRAFPLKGNEVSPSYHLVAFSARQKVEFGMFNELYWQVNGGTFWNTSKMQFPDFHHVAASKFPLTERSFNNGFSLLNNYAYSTNKRWAQANVSWHTPYLLIKHLPFLKKKLFDEALHVRSLVTYGNHPYTEVGYSIGASVFGRIGVFAGFDRLKYSSVGVSVSLPLTLLGED